MYTSGIKWTMDHQYITLRGSAAVFRTKNFTCTPNFVVIFALRIHLSCVILLFASGDTDFEPHLLPFIPAVHLVE